MKIHVIVNPNAGKRIIQRNLEQIIGKLILDGTAESIRVTRTGKRPKMQHRLRQHVLLLILI